MKLWKRIRYFFNTGEVLISFKILFDFKSDADMTLGTIKKEILVSPKDALAKDYVRLTDWGNFEVCNKVEKEISNRTNAEAERLLKEARKGKDVIHNTQGVWIEGKHVVAVDWDVAYPDFKSLTFEEY